MGARNIDIPNPTATMNAVMPVLPPSRIPTEDSAKTVRGEVPVRRKGSDWIHSHASV